MARARYVILLDDRRFGRLNNPQAARILEDMKQNVPTEERVSFDGTTSSENWLTDRLSGQQRAWTVKEYN